jgi:hypothetical protein
VWARIGRTLQSFPPSKRRGRLATHSAFQLGRTTPIGQMRHGDGKAHQPSSCRPLLASLHLLPDLFVRLPLTDLHPVWAITAKRWATTPPPPSVLHARIFASRFLRQSRIGVPHFHAKRRLERPVAACSPPRGLRESAPTSAERMRQPPSAACDGLTRLTSSSTRRSGRGTAWSCRMYGRPRAPRPALGTCSPTAPCRQR